VGGEANIGNEAGLFEAVHAFANFHVHPPVRGGEGLQQVLLYDFVGNDAEGKSHVCPVCPAGLHVEGVLVICSRGTRVLVSLDKGEALTYPLGRVPTAPLSWASAERRGLMWD
jgi:hypothetical protein